MQKKFQVFVSSTYIDLVDERQDTLKSILDLGHIPAGMEGFHAADQEQLTYIKRIVDECDYYILILAGRYGSVDDEGISYTEREYDYAVSRGITVLAFIHGDIPNLSASRVDSDPGVIQRLNEFKEKVRKRRLVSFWKSRDELKSTIIISLSKTIADMPGAGWVRGDAAASDEVLAQLNTVRNEVERLRQENSELISQLNPAIQNLANLSEIFNIRYTYFHDSYRGKRNDILSLSWADVFTVIGPSFFAPRSGFATTVDYLLKRYLWNNVNSQYSTINIFGEDVDTIKVQMDAYRLLRTYQAETVSGGVAEFTMLTDFGKRILAEVGTRKTTLPTKPA